jgi:hypothetical protein
MIGTIDVRHPYVGEVPEELMAGFEAFKIDQEWQWVLVHEGKVKAQLLGANAHGVLIILRLTATKDAPHGWAVKMFRAVMRECKENGVIGFTTFLDDRQKPEVKLMKIVQRFGYLLPASGAWAAGSTEVRY